MDNYSFDFNAKDCNKMYFKEIRILQVENINL